MQELALARSLNYPEYPELRLGDKSSFARLIDDAKEYLAAHPGLARYHFWPPELGCATIGA